MNLDSLEHRIAQLEFIIRDQYSNYTIDEKLKDLESKVMNYKSELPYSLIRSSTQFLTTSTNSYFDIPIESRDIYLSRGGCISIDEPNVITINQSGTYQITCNLTVEVPKGNTKYEISLFRKGKIIESLSKGYVTAESPTWFGVSGSTVVKLEEKDEIGLKYIFNSKKNLASKSISISFIKI